MKRIAEKKRAALLRVRRLIDFCGVWRWVCRGVVSSLAVTIVALSIYYIDESPQHSTEPTTHKIRTVLSLFLDRVASDRYRRMFDKQRRWYCCVLFFHNEWMQLRIECFRVIVRNPQKQYQTKKQWPANGLICMCYFEHLHRSFNIYSFRTYMGDFSANRLRRFAKIICKWLQSKQCDQCDWSHIFTQRVFHIICSYVWAYDCVCLTINNNKYNKSTHEFSGRKIPTTAAHLAAGDFAQTFWWVQNLCICIHVWCIWHWHWLQMNRIRINSECAHACQCVRQIMRFLGPCFAACVPCFRISGRWWFPGRSKKHTHNPTEAHTHNLTDQKNYHTCSSVSCD